MAGPSIDRKQPNLLDQYQAVASERLKKNEIGKSFEKIRTDSSKKAFDTTKAEKSFDEMIDFVIKCTLAAAKNIDPTSEDSGSKSSDMLATATAMATVGAAKQQVAKMNEMLEAIQNPGYNGIELLGKEVSYNSNKRFDGKNPVQFKYNINYPEQYSGASVSTTIKVKNVDGKVVYETRGNGQLGDHEFSWNGLSNKGEKMPAGTYSIEVSARGTRDVGGNKIPFNVDATSLNTATVTSVEMQNNVERLVLSNGEIIDKDQVARVKSNEKNEAGAKLSNDLISNFVEIDLSKAQSLNGNIDVYYNNHVEKPGKATIKISNSKGYLVKTLESDKIKEKGTGTISFSNTGLESGIYNVEIIVEDKNRPGASETLSKEPISRLVKGINYKNNTVVTIDNNDIESEFKAHSISSVFAKSSILQARAENYIGDEVNYDDSKFEFAGAGNFKPIVFAKQSDEAGALISYEELRIYNQNDDLVATLGAEYNPVEYLDKTPEELNQYVRLPDNSWVKFSDLNPSQKPKAYRFIEQELKAGRYNFKNADLKALFDTGYRSLKFPAWDGVFTSGPNLGGRAQVGEVYSTRRATIHLKQDGNVFATDPVHMGNGRVRSFDIEDGKIFLTVQRIDGDIERIEESQLL